MSNVVSGGMLAGKKTYITAVVGIVGAVGAYLVGEADLFQTFQLIVTAVAAASIRAGVAKL